MSRTYKCTKGASKRLTGFWTRQVNDDSWNEDERGTAIDYINGTPENKDYADGLRSGYRHHAPRWYRKNRHARHMNKHMQRVRNAIKYDEYDNLMSLVLKKDADYHYY